MSRGEIYLVTYLIVGTPLYFLAWLVYSSSRRSKVNISLIMLCLTCALWLAALFYSDYDNSTDSTFWDTLTLFFSGLISLALFYFSRNVIYSTRHSKKIIFLFNALILIKSIAILFAPDFIGKRVLVGGQYNYVTSNGYLLYMILTFGVLIESIYHIRKKAYSTGDQETIHKYKLIVRGGTVGISLNLFAEIVFVIFNKEPISLSIFYNLTSAIGILYFACSATYAVLRYGLFDARRAAIRTLGYFVSLVFLAIIYGVMLLAFTHTILESKTSYQELATVVVLVALVAMTFPYVKQFFDKLSRRLFFKDSYDSSVVLGRLNDIFIAEQNLEPMLSNSLSVIGNSIAPAYAELFAVDKYKSIGAAAIGKKQVNKQYAVDRMLNAPWPENNLLVINDPSATAQAKSYLQAKGADLMLRLSTKDVVVGYLLLGPKRSGDKYTEQDVNLLKIIAKNLGLAIQGSMQYTKIQEFNKTLREEVASATSDLRRTNRQLNKLAQAKDEMISMVSHQLIPQLTATHGFIELMERSSADKDELIKLSRSSTARMTRLAQDMLNSTKIQAGELKLEREHINLVALVQGEIDNLSYAAQKHKVDITYTHPDEYPLFADPSKLREAIFNIIDNAIQYSPSDSVVEIEIKGRYLRITDHGIGIPKDEQKKLFTKFFRASNAVSHRPNGSGIGLFVSAQIIHAHGYELKIVSKKEVGTKVEVRFK